jgi:hypothetical protein
MAAANVATFAAADSTLARLFGEGGGGQPTAGLQK